MNALPAAGSRSTKAAQRADGVEKAGWKETIVKYSKLYYKKELSERLWNLKSMKIDNVRMVVVECYLMAKRACRDLECGELIGYFESNAADRD